MFKRYKAMTFMILHFVVNAIEQVLKIIVETRMKDYYFMSEQRNFINYT